MSAKDDLKKAKEEKEARRIGGLSIVDGKYVANFQVEERVEPWGWSNYEKIFDSIDDFASYADEFLNL